MSEAHQSEGNVHLFPKQGAPGGTRDEASVDNTEGELRDDRLRDVEQSVQDTREQMIKGFGDVNTSIERTNTNIETTRSDMISRISDTQKDMADRVNTAEKELSEKLNTTHKELGNKIGARAWAIMGILLAVLIGGLGIVTSVILNQIN